MSDDRIIDEADPDMAAAEFALGVIEGDERAAALRRLLSDPQFAADVARWRRYLAQLFEFWPEAVPTGDVLARVERTIDGASAAPAPRNWGWPAAAVASAIAAALLLTLLLRPVTPPVPTPGPTIAATSAPLLVAAIKPQSGDPLSAVYDPAIGRIRLTSASLAAKGKSAELWVITGDGVPHSLGLLNAGDATEIDVRGDDRARVAAGSVLAVSIEPEGGSPTGAPTGPVVATGALSTV